MNIIKSEYYSKSSTENQYSTDVLDYNKDSQSTKGVMSHIYNVLGNENKYAYLDKDVKQKILDIVVDFSDFDPQKLRTILVDEVKKSGLFEETKDKAQKTGDMWSVLLYIDAYIKHISMLTQKDRLSVELSLRSFDARKYLMESDWQNGSIRWLSPSQEHIYAIQKLSLEDKIKKIPEVFCNLLGNKHFPGRLLSSEQAKILAKVYDISDFYSPEKKVIMHKRMLVGNSPETPVFNDLQTRILFEFGFLNKEESDILSEKKSESKIDTNFDNFNSLDYLKEFYSKIGEENTWLLNTFDAIYHTIPSGGSLLEFGGGPTLYQLISASSKVNEIIFSEYGTENRLQIQSWLDGHKDAFDWTEYFVFVAKLENSGFESLSETDQKQIISDMQTRLKSSIKSIISCDAYQTKPLINTEYMDKQFDTVSVNFVPESATYNAIHYKGFMKNIASLLKEGGTLVMSYLIGSDYYHVGNMKFPAFSVDTNYVKDTLSELGFTDIQIIKGPAAEANQGYEGMGCVTAKKAPKE